MRVRMTLAAAVAASLTLGACASAGGGGTGMSSSFYSAGDGGAAATAAATASAGESRSSRAPIVRVENRNWSDVVVYAVRSGRKQRLGMVTSMSMSRFRLPESMVVGTGELQLLVDPIGSSNGYLSAPVQVGPGQDVAFNVQNYLPMSTVSVWERR